MRLSGNSCSARRKIIGRVSGTSCIRPFMAPPRCLVDTRRNATAGLHPTSGRLPSPAVAVAEIPARPKPPRWVLVALLAGVGVLLVASNLGGLFQATLVKRHPTLLIALNSRNAFLILVTNQLDPVTY